MLRDELNNQQRKTANYCYFQHFTVSLDYVTATFAMQGRKVTWMHEEEPL